MNNSKRRVFTAIVLLAVIIPCALIDNSFFRCAFLVLSAFMCGVGGYEHVACAAKERPHLNKVKFFIPVISALLCLSAILSTSSMIFDNDYYKNYANCVIPFIVYFVSNLSLYLYMIFSKSFDGNDFGICLSAITYTGLMFGFALSTRFIETDTLKNINIYLTGPKCFIFLYLIVAGTDCFAYLFGRKYGKRKLCPEISPNKSVEGAVAGLVFGGIIGVISTFVFKIVDVSLLNGFGSYLLVIVIALLVSALISVFSQLGDLVESKIKRTYNVKDFGNILPGHGGILDRFDSFILSGFVFYVVVLISEILVIIL